MKKTISGRKYDTETAARVGGCDNGMLPGDLDYEAQTLYRKRNGEYFLFGQGGARSRYATDAGYGSFAPGEAISPMPYKKARAWARKNLDPDDYESEFGEVPEGAAGTAVLSCTVSAGAKARLEREAARTGVAQGAVVERLLMTLEG